MALQKQVELSIGPDTTGLLISGLDIEFNISRTLKFADNSAEFTIYNANQSTQEDILKEGNNLVFSAGYEGSGADTIFIGNIKESSTLPDGVDSVTKIKAYSLRSQKKSAQTSLQSFSFNSGSNLKSVINEIAVSMDVPVIGLNNADINLPNGFNYSGRIKGALRQCKRILDNSGVLISFDNSSLVLSGGNKSDAIEVVNLTFDTGLLKVKKVNDETKNTKKKTARQTPKIQFETIMIPTITPNSLVKIDTEEIQGEFLVIKVRYQGDNMSGRFGLSVEAEEAK